MVESRILPCKRTRICDAIFLASALEECSRYTEDVDVVFYEEKQFVVNFGTWTINQCFVTAHIHKQKLHKQKLVKPKPLAGKLAVVKKLGQKNGEVILLVEYLFCDCTEQESTRVATP